MDKPQEIAENPDPAPKPEPQGSKPGPDAAKEGPKASKNEPQGSTKGQQGSTKGQQGSTPRRGGAALIFAIVGVVIALVAGGVYLYKEATSSPPRTPEETINEFLAAVFLASDPIRVSAVICQSWDPVDAVERTTKEIGAETSVSWDGVQVLSSTEDRVSARARLGFRRRDDNQPALYRQWRFSLVKEKTWRVCEARPFVI